MCDPNLKCFSQEGKASRCSPSLFSLISENTARKNLFFSIASKKAFCFYTLQPEMPAFLCQGQGDKNSERTHSPLLPCKFHQGHLEEKNSSQLLPTLPNSSQLSSQLLPIPQLAAKSPLLSQLGVKLPCPARQSDFVLSQLIVKTLAVCVSCGFLLGHWGAGQLIPGLERRPSF